MIKIVSCDCDVRIFNDRLLSSRPEYFVVCPLTFYSFQIGPEALPSDPFLYLNYNSENDNCEEKNDK